MIEKELLEEFSKLGITEIQLTDRKNFYLRTTTKHGYAITTERTDWQQGLQQITTYFTKAVKEGSVKTTEKANNYLDGLRNHLDVHRRS